MPLTWQEGGIQFFDVGSNYLGNIVHPPVTDVAQYINLGLLPFYRQGLQMQMVGREPLPQVVAEVSQQVAEPGVQKQVVAERVRVRYALQGQSVDEDFYVALVFAQSQIAPGMTLWQAQKQYAFRAPAGELDRYAPLLNAMVSSVRVQPRWMAGYQYVMQLKNQNQLQAIRDAGELSQRIAQNSDQIMRMNREAYENQQRSQDRLAHQFSQTIRGVGSYSDPYSGGTVELPSQYRDVWVSETGGYLLSNDANFNPNEHDTVNWQRAPAVEQ